MKSTRRKHDTIPCSTLSPESKLRLTHFTYFQRSSDFLGSKILLLSFSLKNKNWVRWARWQKYFPSCYLLHSAAFLEIKELFKFCLLCSKPQPIHSQFNQRQAKSPWFREVLLKNTMPSRNKARYAVHLNKTSNQLFTADNKYRLHGPYTTF